ncbi:LOW QUALITY PROTEIN: conserved oligomeric Golgi complex subunit 6-like [Ctenocephalides felis]|uniref:LOW QUALITY PROTEIN: conserved oligomeric Golgi complex subunit 6-like n=1 Tax=Ctenocephalides felis TaxID=7515 RepID=UPI000E6E50A3|nr:LOW QUALITY PROTEIN: conserved oligomeric Golgi complex subunit 6-like [Ctenocephalides felis]
MDTNKDNTILIQRVNKILETRLDNDEETLEALKNLSTFYTENTADNRRNLKYQIQERTLAMNDDFLQAFREVKLALDSVLEDVNKIDNSAQIMQDRLNQTKRQTHQLIEQTNSLQDECKNLEAQRCVAEAFVKQFQLSQEELDRIYGSGKNEMPIDDNFFKILDRIKQIRNECRSLSQFGFKVISDIIDQMTIHEEAALERLHRWTQSHCRNESDNPQISQLVRRAMNKLQDRPVLFKYVMDEYSTSRRALLVRAFIDAMTVGGTTEPLEMHSHDPKRYIGDMLAWLHQAMPEERECLNSLLKCCDNNDMSEHTQSALCHIVDGVCHPLKIRIQKIISSEKQTGVLYSVTSVIRFYQNLMKNSISGGVLDATLTELIEQSEKAYMASLQELVNEQLKAGINNSAPPNDLSPSQNVIKLMSTLKEILSVAAITEAKEGDTKKIVSCVLDPLLRDITEAASRLSTTDMSVYLLNCFFHIKCSLALYEHTDDRLERLQAQCDAQLDTLTSEQASSLVVNLSLGPIYTILQDQINPPLSKVPGMDASNLKIFANKLDNLIEMPEVLLLPQVGLLISNAHRKTIQQRSFDVIIAIYTKLYESVNLPENEYRNPKNLMKSPEIVKQLLLGEK